MMSKMKILVADDDQSIREMLRLMLEAFDYEVLHAKDGIEALETLRSSPERFVVLLDWFMPRLNGHEVLQRIASDTLLSAQHTYILLSANHNSPLSEQKALTFPVAILHKPFAMDDLLRVVDEATQHLTHTPPIQPVCCN